jgi:hypothetical protein
VDPRAGLDDMEKRIFLTLRGLELELRSPRSSKRRASLYRLRYPGSWRRRQDVKINLTHMGNGILNWIIWFRVGKYGEHL